MNRAGHLISGTAWASGTVWAVLLAGQLLFSDAMAQPYAERAAFFGDLHLHTGLSFDAAASGTNTTPDDAYRYALGQSVEYMGRSVRINRPLDFMAVTDHAEYLGVAMEAADPNGRFADTSWPANIGANIENTLVYYARVLEIPTPRWSTHLAAANGLPLSDAVPATIQERAWSSPVFYSPR